MAKRASGRLRAALSRGASRLGSADSNTPEPRPRSSESLEKRVKGVEGWETMSPIDLARLLELTSFEATQVLQLMHRDRARSRR